MRVGVIGAGIAGLTAAQSLQEHGHNVDIFDKSRGVGGRTATRRCGPYAFDHGAQYFTVRAPRFRRIVDHWIKSGVVAEWPGSVVSISKAGVAPGPSSVRYVGLPGMNAMAKQLANSLNVMLGRTIKRITKSRQGWRFVDNTESITGEYDVFILALPSAQAIKILESAGITDERIIDCQLTPCWAVMLGLEERVGVSFDAAFVDGSPLSWVARNNSKPGRTVSESWVLHGTPEWSTTHLDQDAATVADELTTAFEDVAGLDQLDPTHREAHRWRYAQPPDPLDDGSIIDRDAGWIVCGDWCHGARLEGAFLSGLSAAAHLVDHEDIMRG
ncbi:MAG: hypothetical protein DHS20C16_20880 [Phycisphaerae bacterium]|nr:MAG: hypothetical protein DHS20C16_20880 [Phycisphaerae bacterium]